jgi:ferrous-iron efflux pump FieF
MADAVSELPDQELPASQREQIIGIARGHSQVRGVDDLRTRSAGRMDFIELPLELDDHIPLIVAHEVSDAAGAAIIAAIPQADLMIHFDPVGFAEEQLDDRIEAEENA